MAFWVPHIGQKAKRTLLQFGVAKIFLIGRCVFGHSETLVGPSTQVNAFAPGAAKGAVSVLGAKKTGTTAGGALHLFGLGGWLTHLSLTRFIGVCALRAERHFKGGVFFVGNQFAIDLLLHESNHHQQTVATDFRGEVQAVVDSQAEQLKITTLR